jgi:hypothetical protein
MNKLLASLALSATALFPLASSARPVLSITPSTQAAAVGDTVVVDVSISGLNAINEIASAFDLNVLFSASILNGVTVAYYGAVFGGNANILVSSSFDPGNMGGILNSFSSDDDLALLQTANAFNIVQFKFTALAAGDTFLNFGPSLDFDRAVVGRNGLNLDLDYVGACVSVGASAPGTGCQNNPVPEPASFALVGLALLAGGAAGRKGLRVLQKA